MGDIVPGQAGEQNRFAVDNLRRILSRYFDVQPDVIGPDVNGPDTMDSLFEILERKIKDQSRVFEQNQKAILNMLEDLQESKEELQRSKLNFMNLVENDSDGIMVLDKKGLLCFVNPVAERILGHPKEKLLHSSIGYTLNNGDKREIEIEREGHPKIIAEIRGENVSWEGREAFMVTVRDVTYYRVAEEQIRESFEKLRRIQLETVEALSSAGEKRDPYTAGHQHRVAILSCAIAQELEFTDHQIDGIRVAGLLHDIGKIYVPDSILTKPDKLDVVEFEIVKDHPQFGYDILKPIEFPWPVAQIVLQHHERLDGSGYPNNLKDADILMESKIVAVADVIEAMSCDRPYRAALSMDVVLNEVIQKKGILFEPAVVEACRRLFTEKGFKFPKQVS
ncbi:MAG: HD-GYP domain-containing protein [Candidatus Omnitrophica bacterium]|nr:HD-GYP domain-containing protein [Candidatus Omnitrophota bacterium]